jgi:hypothetical protein
VRDCPESNRWPGWAHGPIGHCPWRGGGKTRELNKSKYMGHPQRVDSRVAGGIENGERATSGSEGRQDWAVLGRILTANSAKLAIGVTPGREGHTMTR